jgi:hypothetical protein
MLTKKEIEQLIDKQNSSLRIVKPIVTPKFSAVWNSFSCMYVNDIKQEYVILFLTFEMTFFNYKNKKETRNLEK